MNHRSAPALLITATVWCASLAATLAADSTDGRFSKERLAEGLKNVARTDQDVAGQLAPKLEKDARAIQDVVTKYKDRTESALPELQADLDGVKASLSETAASITNEAAKARWTEFQNSLLTDARDGALDTMAEGLSTRLELDPEQINRLQPVIRDHLTGVMDLVEEGRKAGLDGVPALAESLRRKSTELDSRLTDVLNPEQMAEIHNARSELREKLFGDITDREVAALMATMGEVPGKADAIRNVLEADVKAKTQLLEATADAAKGRISPLKDELDAINRDTREKLKNVVPAPDLEKLDARKRDGDAKLLSAGD